MLPRLHRNSKASIVGAKVYKYTFDMFNKNYELIRAPYVKELDRYNLINDMNIQKEQNDAHKEQMGKLTSTEMTSKNQFCRMIANLGLYALDLDLKSEKNSSTPLLDKEINLMKICGTPGQNTDIDTHLWNTIKTQYTSTDTLDKPSRKRYVINNAAQQMSSWNKQVFCPLSSVKDGQLNCNEGQIGEYGDMSFMITTPIDNCGDDFENNTMYYNGIVSIIPWNNYPNATYELNIKTPKFDVIKLHNPPPDLIAWKVLQDVLTKLTIYIEKIKYNKTQIYDVPIPFIRMTLYDFLLKDNPVEGIFGNVYEAIIYPYRKPIINEVESSDKKEEEKKPIKRKQGSNEPQKSQKSKKSKPNAEKERSGSLTDAADAAEDAEAAEDAAAAEAAEAISKELLEIVWGILFKGTGDIFQEINALCKYGGYTSSPNYINNTEIIEWDNTGNVKRIFFANDRPSASRFISMLKEGRDEDVNINASGGYKPFSENEFLVKKELTSDAAGGEKAGGGKRKTKRRSTQKKCKNTHKKKSIRKNTKNKQQVRKTCKIQRYRKHKYTNKRRQRKQNKKK